MKTNTNTRMLTILVLALVVGLPAGVANADFTFGTPTNLGPPLNSSSADQGPTISADGLSLFFISDRPGGYGGLDIWVTIRATTDDSWGTPVNLGPTINTPFDEWNVSISSDSLSLYFTARQPGASSDIDDIWLTMRETKDDPWGEPVNLGPTVNTSADDWGPNISADDLSLYFISKRPGGYGSNDLWVTTRETIHDPWGTPVNLGPTVNSSGYDVDPDISGDGRTLFFTFMRSGGYGRPDIWVTRRATTNDDWGEPVNLGSTINSSAVEGYPNVSADGSTLFFFASLSNRHSGGDIWQVPIEPVVDFNGDGIVDAADMCIMVDYWGTDEPLCDVGPMPWGDGIVDVQDLIVLSEHLFEDYRLVAHWAMDEIEGDIAYDSAGNNHGNLNGNPIWQPAGGMYDGALEFDGIDDYISTVFVSDPSEEAFSVFAWIKDGAPGQAVISEPAGPDWLGTDPLDGFLMTELAEPGRSATPLLSETIITDGEWHRIGFTWDGSKRTLDVDGFTVAEDTQDSLEGSYTGLYIGAGKDLDSTSFFSGLIDDVRIYNRAMRP